MYFTDTEIERCRFPLSDLRSEFNRLLTTQSQGQPNKSDLLPFDNSIGGYQIDEITLSKLIWTIGELITDKGLRTDWQGNDISHKPDADEWAYYKMRNWRKAWKGVQIAASKSGLSIPTDHDQQVEDQWERFKLIMENRK